MWSSFGNTVQGTMNPKMNFEGFSSANIFVFEHINGDKNKSFFVENSSNLLSFSKSLHMTKN